MEPTPTTRLILPLAKCRVVNRTNNMAKIDIGQGVGMLITLPDNVDLREGDILTLYTEVPYAQPSRTPIQ